MDTPLLRVMDSFCGPNYTQIILINDPALVDTRPSFLQDCPLSLLTLKNWHLISAVTCINSLW